MQCYWWIETCQFVCAESLNTISQSTSERCRDDLSHQPPLLMSRFSTLSSPHPLPFLSTPFFSPEILFFILERVSYPLALFCSFAPRHLVMPTFLAFFCCLIRVFLLLLDVSTIRVNNERILFNLLKCSPSQISRFLNILRLFITSSKIPHI